jgi:hypothetical protein
MVCSACWLCAWRSWEDCYAQVNRYRGNLYKIYNTEAEALRAYNGLRSANLGHQLEIQIEEKPLARDVKIRIIAPCSSKDVMLFLVLWSLIFLFVSSFRLCFYRIAGGQ